MKNKENETNSLTKFKSDKRVLAKTAVHTIREFGNIPEDVFAEAIVDIKVMEKVDATYDVVFNVKLEGGELRRIYLKFMPMDYLKNFNIILDATIRGFRSLDDWIFNEIIPNKKELLGNNPRIVVTLNTLRLDEQQTVYVSTEVCFSIHHTYCVDESIDSNGENMCYLIIIGLTSEKE